VLPYGCWVCEDGREVLFNRFYEPIWQRRGGNAEPADCHERVGHARQSWFYTDADCEKAKRTKAIAGLAGWGLPVPPPPTRLKLMHRAASPCTAPGVLARVCARGNNSAGRRRRARSRGYPTRSCRKPAPEAAPRPGLARTRARGAKLFGPSRAAAPGAVATLATTSVGTDGGAFTLLREPGRRPSDRRSPPRAGPHIRAATAENRPQRPRCVRISRARTPQRPRCVRISRARTPAERKYSPRRAPPRPRRGYDRLYRRMCNREGLSAYEAARTDAEIETGNISHHLCRFLFAGGSWCET
jgi:hypothetical protein